MVSHPVVNKDISDFVLSVHQREMKSNVQQRRKRLSWELLHHLNLTCSICPVNLVGKIQEWIPPKCLPFMCEESFHDLIDGRSDTKDFRHKRGQEETSISALTFTKTWAVCSRLNAWWLYSKHTHTHAHMRTCTHTQTSRYNAF